MDLATGFNILDKRGAYYRYGEMLLGQGRENAKTFLEENTAVMLELENLIRQEAGLPTLGRAAELTYEADAVPA